LTSIAESCYIGDKYRENYMFSWFGKKTAKEKLEIALEKLAAYESFFRKKQVGSWSDTMVNKIVNLEIEIKNLRKEIISKRTFQDLANEMNNINVVPFKKDLDNVSKT
jgi:hypothetical protein